MVMELIVFRIGGFIIIGGDFIVFMMVEEFVVYLFVV